MPESACLIGIASRTHHDFSVNREKGKPRMNRHASISIWIGLAATSLIAGDVWAGFGSVVYGPPAISVPMLSEAMLLVLGLLFAVLAYRTLTKLPGGKPLASLAALAIAGLAAFAGPQLIMDSYASNPGMVVVGGGVVSVGIAGNYEIINSTNQSQEIKSVTPANNCVAAVATPTQCVEGLVVPYPGSCFVNFQCDR